MALGSRGFWAAFVPAASSVDADVSPELLMCAMRVCRCGIDTASVRAMRVSRSLTIPLSAVCHARDAAAMHSRHPHGVHEQHRHAMLLWPAGHL